MAETINLSQVIENRRAQGLPVDDAAIQSVRDNYLAAVTGGKTDKYLVDDTAGDNVQWVVKPGPDGNNMWQPTEEPIQEDLLNDIIAGLSFNTLAKPSAEGSLPGKVAGLASMIASAGGVGNAMYQGARLLPRMAAHGSALGVHSGMGAAAAGGDAGDVAASAAQGFGLGAGLTGLSAVHAAGRALATKLGEAGLWGGLEAVSNPDASALDIAGAAGVGMVASRLARTPYATRYEPIEQATAAPREPIRLLPAGPEPVSNAPMIARQRARNSRVSRQKALEVGMMMNPDAARKMGFPTPTGTEPIPLPGATNTRGIVMQPSYGVRGEAAPVEQASVEAVPGTTPDQASAYHSPLMPGRSLGRGRRGGDTTLGVGLGGAHGVDLTKSVFRPANLSDKPSNSSLPISQAMHEYAKSGDFNAAMPGLVAHKANPAPSPEFMAELAEIPGAEGRHGLWAAPRTHVIQAMGGGRINNAFTRETLGHMEEADLLEHRLSDTYVQEYQTHVNDKYKLKPKDSGRLTALMPSISSADVKVSNAELLARPEIAEAVKGLKPADAARLLGAAKSTRVLFNRARQRANNFTDTLELNSIPYKENYWPRREKQTGIESFKKVPDRGHYTARKEGYRGTPSMHQGETADYPVEQDYFRLVEMYGQEASRHVANQVAISAVTPQIEAIRKHAAALVAPTTGPKSMTTMLETQIEPSPEAIERAKRLNNAADTLEHIIDLDYQGGKTRLDELSDSIVASVPQVFVPLRNALRAMSAANTRAHLGGIRWMLTTQWSSGALVDARVDAQSHMKAKEQMRDPVLRAWVRRNSYASKMKSRGSGSVTAQDGGLVNSRIRRQGVLSKWGDIVSKPGSIMEDNLNIYSYLAGYNEMLSRGGTHEEAMAFGDDLVKKTQSMYDRKNRSEALKSADLVVAFKYSTFQVEMFNMMREMGVTENVFGKTGAYEDAFKAKEPIGNDQIPWHKDPKQWLPGQRAWFLAKLLALAAVQNEITMRIAGKENWTITSLLPFSSNVIGGYGAYGHAPYAAQQALSLWSHLKDFVDDGELKPLEGILSMLDYSVSNYLPAGSDLTRAAKASLAISNGEWKGKEIDTDNHWQSIQAVVMGGRAAYEDRQSSLSDAMDFITGDGDTPSPQTQRRGRSLPGRGSPGGRSPGRRAPGR